MGGWTPPPTARRGGGGGVAVGVILALVVVLVLGGGIGAYLLTRPDGGGADPNRSAGAGRQSSGPGRFDLTKLPPDLCPTIAMEQINGPYEEAIGDPTRSRNLNTFVGTATCTLSRMHRSDTTAATASVMSMVSVYADLASGAAAGKQMIDSARLNGPVTEIEGVGDQAVAYTDKQQPTAITITFVGVESNLVCNITLIVGAGGKTFTDAQIRDLESRLVAIGKATFTKTVAAIS